MRWLLLAAFVSLVITACSSPATPTPTSTPSATPVSSAATVFPQSASDSLAIAPEVADELRKLAFAYWEAFNAYEADRALSYLEPAYRAERESTIRGDIGRIRTFGVKLGVSEATPPQLTASGEAEMYLSMKEPLGTRRIRMAFRQVDAAWKITFAQEVK